MNKGQKDRIKQNFVLLMLISIILGIFESKYIELNDKPSKVTELGIIILGSIMTILFWVELYIYIKNKIKENKKPLRNISVNTSYDMRKSSIQNFVSTLSKVKESKTIASFKSVKNGYQFEYYVAQLLRDNNFKNVKVTKSSGDQGVDIKAESKEGVKYAIQTKFYTGNVGNDAVQQIIAGKSYYGAHVGVVITNSSFTRSAKELAEKTGVLLWDKTKLNEWEENIIDKDM